MLIRYNSITIKLTHIQSIIATASLRINSVANKQTFDLGAECAITIQALLTKSMLSQKFREPVLCVQIKICITKHCVTGVSRLIRVWKKTIYGDLIYWTHLPQTAQFHQQQ